MTNQGTKTYTINPGGSQIIPEGYHSGSGKVTANANQNSGTYTFASGSTGATVDMGINNTYRYVNASNVYTKGQSDGVSGNNFIIFYILNNRSDNANLYHYAITSSTSGSNLAMTDDGNLAASASGKTATVNSNTFTFTYNASNSYAVSCKASVKGKFTIINSISTTIIYKVIDVSANTNTLIYQNITYGYMIFKPI